MAKFLIIAGVILMIAGLIMLYAPRFPFPGKLPGDILLDKGNFKMFIPITTSIIISIVLSLIFYFVNKAK